MKNFITLVLTVLYLPVAATGTFKADSSKSNPDSGSVKKQSVSVGIDYGSDASFFGRTSQYRHPFVTSDIIYNAKSGLFVYGSAWKVLSSTPTVDEFDLGAGYSYKPSKYFKGSISYTRFLFADKAEIIKSSSSNDINFKNTLNLDLFSTSVTLDYLFGKSHDFFVTYSNSHYFESKFSIFDDKDYLTFNPSISVIWGTQNFVERFSQDHDFFSPPNDPSKPPSHSPPFTDDYAAKNTEFNVLNYSFKLPIGYNRPHYTVEASYKYAVPVNVQGSLMNIHQSFFNLTFYYLFY